VSTYNLVHRGVVTVTVGDVSPKDIALPSSVKLGSAFVIPSIREARLPDPVLDLDYRGATIRLLDASTLRLEWNGTLSTDPDTGGTESITVAYQVYDLENLGDDLKEILFRLQRALAYLGENVLQDRILYSSSGVMTQYRLRVFDSKAHANAATKDVPDATPLQTGEIARSTVTQDVIAGKNDRRSLAKVLDLLLVTPGVD
jgi:hypothetical protein